MNANVLYNQMVDSGDTNGCSVIAFAQLLDLNYSAANRIAMNKYGREWRRGMYLGELLKMYRDELKQDGLQLTRLDKRKILEKVSGKNYVVKTLTSNNIKRAKLKGTYLIVTRSHVTIMKGGKVTDWTTNKATHITSVYKLEKKT